MILTEDQGRAWAAIQEVAALPRSRGAPPSVLIIAGYAGTGKTTLMRYAVEFFRGCTICTPTGKAALRVKEATGLEATTFHRWLYDTSTDPKTGKPVFKPKDHPVVPSRKLLVIDEGSMVGEADWEELFRACQSSEMNIVVLGDSFQLPPVVQKADGPPFSLLSPDFAYSWKRVEMKQIVRQALDRPLVRSSMLLRQGSPSDAVDAVMLLDRLPRTADVPTAVAETLARGGVAICHTNKTRNALNRQVRPIVFSGKRFDAETINPGEPLLCTYNNYDLNMFNGEVVQFDEWNEPPRMETVRVHDKFKNKEMFCHFGTAMVDDQAALIGVEEVLGLDNQGIGFGAYAKAAKDDHPQWEYKELWIYGERQERLVYTGPPYLNANLGYALTCHKSQGSEWPEVLVIFEDTMSIGRLGNDLFARRWLYTAITRAKQRAVFTTWTAP